MWPLVAPLLLESLLAPFALAGMIMVAAGKVKRHRLAAVAPAFAILLAVVATYALAFGWTGLATQNARTKVMLAAVLGFTVGILAGRDPARARAGLCALAIAIPVWIGLSALQQGHPASALVVLPILAGVFVAMSTGGRDDASGTSPLLMMLTIAAGLAVIAVFARALSFAELGLSLASALLALLMIGRRPLAPPAAITSAATLLALTTALLLYSEVSLPALLVLSSVLAAERLARSASRTRNAPSNMRILPFCLVPAVVAVLIARIDAGPISIY